MQLEPFRFDELVSCYIVKLIADFAKIDMVLMSKRTEGDVTQHTRDIIQGRKSFQDLNTAAAMASNLNPNSRAVTPTSSVIAIPTGSRASSPANSLEGIDRFGNIDTPGEEFHTPGRETKKATQYIKKNRQPNVHVALHYPDVIKKYGQACMVNVLIGEGKHKYILSHLLSQMLKCTQMHEESYLPYQSLASKARIDLAVCAAHGGSLHPRWLLGNIKPKSHSSIASYPRQLPRVLQQSAYHV